MENKRNLLTLLIVGTLYLIAILCGCCNNPKESLGANEWIAGGPINTQQNAYVYTKLKQYNDSDTLVLNLTYRLQQGNKSIESTFDTSTDTVSAVVIVTNNNITTQRKFDSQTYMYVDDYIMRSGSLLGLPTDSVKEMTYILLNGNQVIRYYNKKIIDGYKKNN